MGVHDIYSKRNKKQVDVFSYDIVPDKLRIQIAYIWKNFFKQVQENIHKEVWEEIHSTLCEEHALKRLIEYPPFGGRYVNDHQVEQYFEQLTNVDHCLDVIETIFQWIEIMPQVFEKYYNTYFNAKYTPEQAIKDLNTRFLENGVGYEYRDKSIIRVDNTLLHNEIIVETFQFLSATTFKNANDEFMSAHEHFRHKRNKECLTDCLKALETTMKIICQENSWQYDKEKDAAKQLIDICIKNELIPKFLLSHFSGLRTSIGSGVPTLRNKLSGHGQGVDKITVPDHYASYMLYLTGTTINFLVSCQKEIKLFN